MSDFRKVSFEHYDNVITCNDDVITCYEGNNPLICYDSKKRISKEDWWYLVETLEKWHVFSPRAIITKYGALNCWEAMTRTKENRPRNAGAYFTKVVRNMVKIA